MTNPRVAHQLNKIENAMQKLAYHVKHHSGVDPKQAAIIEKDCERIAGLAAMIAEEAILAQPMYKHTAKGLVSRVRKAFGFRG